MRIKGSKIGITSTGVELSSSRPAPKKIQRDSEMFKPFLTMGTWHVLNLETRKQMTIRKGQLVIQFGPKLFSTIDGRKFLQVNLFANDSCLLRPVFQESPTIWSCGV